MIKARQVEDAELRQAFDDRYKNPKQFNQTLGQLRRSIVSKARKDQAFADGANATADREAVAAYMRGASTGKIPEASRPNYGSMSDAEFAAEKKRLGLE